jgi:DNA-binding FrmR family transcriptional regulator
MHDTDQLLNRVLQRLDVIEGKVDTLMSAQSDVDAAVAALNEFLSDVAEQITAIQAELTADGTPVDTSALNAVIAQVPAVQEALDALAPATTTPAPAPSA